MAGEQNKSRCLLLFPTTEQCLHLLRVAHAYANFKNNICIHTRKRAFYVTPTLQREDVCDKVLSVSRAFQEYYDLTAFNQGTGCDGGKRQIFHAAGQALAEARLFSQRGIDVLTWKYNNKDVNGLDACFVVGWCNCKF